MNFLEDVITYFRRIVKTPSARVLSDNLIIDYLSRFYVMDVDPRLQLFDFKTDYQLQTVPGVSRYNMPLYDTQTQPGLQTVGLYPVYQGFFSPCFVDGVEISFHTQRSTFHAIYPNWRENLGVVDQGDGGATYSFTLPILGPTAPPNPPFSGILRGHINTTGIIGLGTNVDPPIMDSITAQLAIPTIPTTSLNAAVFINAIDANEQSVLVTDSGIFLQGDVNFGLLLNPGNAPRGNTVLPGAYTTTSNTINYFTGVVNITFPVVIPTGIDITAQVFFFQSGLPRAVLFFDNTITLRPPPARQHTVSLEAYLSPAAFFQSNEALPFAYMAEYLARGAAQKYLSDVGDWDQFKQYQPLFITQEHLVWKRSQRQKTSTKTETIYSLGPYRGSGYNNYGGSGQ